MQDKEKKLIENLFDRLKNAELNSSSRDEQADILIKNLVKNQPSSAYYMIQTILIQETAIKKMNEKIEELKSQLLQLEEKNNIKKTSFLSGLFSKKESSPFSSSHAHNMSKNENIPATPGANTAIPTNYNNGRSSFLSNALQTATGVAGGMMLGNMLMNLFQHTKPEEDIFNTIHESSLDDNDANILHGATHDNSDHNSDFINYEDNNDYDTPSDSSIYNSDIDDMDDIDINDDNLI
ncbi:DUF2076 domain-containing protein [Buchnera aphidicola]|uniref:DUF2076 domain-containing protein n=1 Tax=Buchnera aphidicola TaxID=9 RepID=UPI003463C741